MTILGKTAERSSDWRAMRGLSYPDLAARVMCPFVGNSIAFNFEYPDGPFHNTFVWDPSNKQWVCRMENKDAAGNWKLFATDTLRRASQ